LLEILPIASARGHFRGGQTDAMTCMWGLTTARPPDLGVIASDRDKSEEITPCG
jgi:hypothetical protein